MIGAFGHGSGRRIGDRDQFRARAVGRLGDADACMRIGCEADHDDGLTSAEGTEVEIVRAGAADDLVHEVFVRLPRAIRRLQPGTPLGGFLIAVAVNNARHHVRAAARRRRAQARLAASSTYVPEKG